MAVWVRAADEHRKEFWVFWRKTRVRRPRFCFTLAARRNLLSHNIYENYQPGLNYRWCRGDFAKRLVPVCHERGNTCSSLFVAQKNTWSVRKTRILKRQRADSVILWNRHCIYAFVMKVKERQMAWVDICVWWILLVWSNVFSVVSKKASDS